MDEKPFNAKQLACDAVLFDLDGVLIDSTACVIRHWETWAALHGLDLDKILKVAYGLRTIETMRLVAPHLDAVKESQQFNTLEIVDMDGVVAIAGAHEILTALPAGAWAVVTSGHLELARARLAVAGLPFPDIFVTAEDVKRGKPEPEPYQIGAQRLGLAPQNCIVIEDAPAGIAAGKSAGMRVIGVASTHAREVLLGTEADVVIDKLADLDIRPSAQGQRLVIRI